MSEKGGVRGRKRERGESEREREGGWKGQREGVREGEQLSKGSDHYASSVSMGIKWRCLGRCELVCENFTHGSRLVLMTT